MATADDAFDVGHCCFCEAIVETPLAEFHCQNCHSIIPRRQADRFTFYEAPGETGEEVVHNLVDALARQGAIRPPDVDPIVQAVLHRESLGSTAIGHGVALPQTKFPGVQHVLGAVAWNRRGVRFYNRDGTPMQLFVLSISCPDAPGDFLRFLERTSRLLKDYLAGH